MRNASNLNDSYPAHMPLVIHHLTKLVYNLISFIYTIKKTYINMSIDKKESIKKNIKLL